jgi:hypothetical protein
MLSYTYPRHGSAGGAHRPVYLLTPFVFRGWRWRWHLVRVASARGSRPSVPRVSPQPAQHVDPSAERGAEHRHLASQVPSLLEQHGEGVAEDA